MRCFRRSGFDGTAISEIAGAVGVSKAAVSFHFESKEAMLFELTGPFLEAAEEVFTRHPQPGWPEGVWDLAGDYFDTLVRHHDVAVWIDGDSSAQRRAGIGDRFLRSIEELVAAIVGDGEDPVDRMRAIAAVGGIWRPVRMLSPQELACHRDDLLHAALVSYAPLERRRDTKPEATAARAEPLAG